MKTKVKNSIIAVSIVVVVLFVLFLGGFFESWQHSLSDSLFTKKDPLPSIVIIAIDDHSLQTIGRWPWDRGAYIPVFEKLGSAKVVGLDVAFFETQDKDIDSTLGALIRKNNNTIIPQEFYFDKNTILKPAQGYENITTGFVNIFTDADSIARSTPLRYQNEDSFAYAIYKQYTQQQDLPYETLTINYIGEPGSFTIIPFADVAHSTYNFTNKIVLIGATAPDLHDEAFVPTSNGKAMPGVEIHANTLQTLLTKRYLVDIPVIATIAIMILVSTLTLLLLIFTPLWLATLGTFALGAIYITLALVLFDTGYILNMVYPTLTALFSYISIVAVFYIYEYIERLRVKSIFGKYVSPDVAEHILKTTTKNEINLEGEERKVALLFADVRGFTSMSEKMKPREVVHMLNQYLGAMTASVFDNRGTLDKYMGDCIMAIFGAPIATKTQALDAVKCALEMQRMVREVSKNADVPKVGVGIGINFGEAIVGNMGSKERVEYTSIGDTVNVASRMCSEAEADEIILTEWTYKEVEKDVLAEYAGEVTVKGKSKPIKIYKVKGLKK